MQYKRAIGLAVLAYLASFVVGLLTIALSAIQFIPTQTTGFFYGIQFVSIVVIGAVFAWWYFRPPYVGTSLKNGFFFGLVVVAVGFVLDTILAIPAIVLGVPVAQFVAMYTDPLFWATLALLLATTTGTGALLARNGAPTGTVNTPHQQNTPEQ